MSIDYAVGAALIGTLSPYLFQGPFHASYENIWKAFSHEVNLRLPKHFAAYKTHLWRVMAHKRPLEDFFC